MINPTKLKESDFDHGNLERVKTGNTVDGLWGMSANYISKQDLIHLLKGGVLATNENEEYAGFYKLDNEALKAA